MKFQSSGISSNPNNNNLPIELTAATKHFLLIGTEAGTSAFPDEGTLRIDFPDLFLEIKSLNVAINP